MKTITGSRLVGASLASLLLVAGCAGEAGSSSWTTSKDVLDSLNAAGIPCPDPQVVPAGEQGGDITSVLCEGFGVALYGDTRSVDAEARGTCSAATLAAEDWALWDEDEFIAGDNWQVYPMSDSGDWPAQAQASEFLEAFGGELVTLADYFEGLGCRRPVSITG